MNHIFDFFFGGLFSYVTLILAVFVTFIVSRICLFISFQKFLQKNSKLSFRGKPLEFFYYSLSAEAGGSWIAQRQHRIVAVIAVVILAWGLIKSFVTESSDAFSRSGSLVVISGFLSVFIGFRHAAAIFEQEKHFNDVIARQNILRNQSVSQSLSSLWVFLITSLGTLIWGYGDLLIKPVIHQSQPIPPTCPIVCQANINREETLIQEQAQQIESINGIIQTMEKEISTIQRQIASLQKSVCELEKQRKPPPPSPRKPIHHRHKFRDSSKSSAKPQFPCSQG